MFFRILKCFVLLYCVSILVYPWVCNTKLFEYCYFRLCIVFIVCIGVSPPPTPSPPKTAPPLFHQALVKPENCPGPPFLGNSPLYFFFFFLALFHHRLVIESFEWFWIGSLKKTILLMLVILKAPFLVLCFTYHTLGMFLMMSSVVLLSMP